MLSFSDRGSEVTILAKEKSNVKRDERDSVWTAETPRGDKVRTNLMAKSRESNTAKVLRRARPPGMRNANVWNEHRFICCQTVFICRETRLGAWSRNAFCKRAGKMSRIRPGGRLGMRLAQLKCTCKLS